MSLKISVLEKVKNDKNLHRALEDFHHKSFYTIHEWCKNDNPMLTTYDSLRIISQYLDTSIEDLIEEKEIIS